VHGDVRVNRQIVGFKKIKFYTLDNVGAGKLSMPEQEMHTTAFWLYFPGAFLARFEELSAAQIQAGLSGLGNALRSVAALLVMCDPRDLGVALGPKLLPEFLNRTCIFTTTTLAASGKAHRSTR